MKRFKLPKGAKAAIRAWVELPLFKEVKRGNFEGYKENTCPFLGLPGRYCERVCERMFPSIPRGVCSCLCPCHCLTLNYIIRRAKEAIK